MKAGGSRAKAAGYGYKDATLGYQALTGVINATDVNNNVQVFQHFLVSRPDNFRVLEAICFLE